MSIELTNKNPWRPADWRWQRALLIVNGELRPNRTFDDRHVQTLTRFARQVFSDDRPDARERLALREPDLFWAYMLNVQDDPARRAEVEARIIANQPRGQIAVRTGIPESTLEAYETNFYDVRDKLIHSSYVLHTLVGTAMHRGIQERDYALVWKYIAFTHGVFAFEAMLTQSIQPGKPKDATGVRACFADAGHSDLLRKQMLAAKSVPLNQFTQIQVLEVYAKFVEMERVAGQNAGAGQNMIINNVQQVLAMLPLDVGIYAKPQVDSPALASYDLSSEELSTPQLIAAARGLLPDDEGPRNLKYPEPLNHARTDNASGTGSDVGAGPSDRTG